MDSREICEKATSGFQSMPGVDVPGILSSIKTIKERLGHGRFLCCMIQDNLRSILWVLSRSVSIGRT
jgi:hypothetical protein